MGQAIQFYETYGWEILGALLVIAVALLVVQMVRLRKLREETAQIVKQVRESLYYAPLDRTEKVDDPFRAFTEKEERQRRQQLIQELDERSRLQRNETAGESGAQSKEKAQKRGLQTVGFEQEENNRDESANDLISSVLEEIFP